MRGLTRGRCENPANPGTRKLARGGFFAPVAGMRLHSFLALLAILLTSCRTGRNYPAPAEPRYAGVAEPVDRPVPDTLRIVSFNIKYAERVDSALVVLTTEPELRTADVLLLQEMDVNGTRTIAQRLNLSYVYYPAIFRHRSAKDFGNAVLSRWPIVADSKIVLPHVSRYARTQRTATAATIRIGTIELRVYSTHLGTPADISSGARQAQLEAIIADAASHPRVVIGGDMNSATVGAVAAEAGFSWPTRHVPATSSFGTWDHIYTRGLGAPERAAAGTVMNIRNASDHRPVWVLALLR
jgi:endonuclease/exonuclease/phosphatase family metal-dependent hydrolase